MRDVRDPGYDNTDDEMELSEEQKAYVRKFLKRLMKLGIGAVYGDEDDNEKPVAFEHGSNLPLCKAICCSFVFALTKEEVQKGHIRWDPQMTYFIRREEDGLCHHLNRETLVCEIWDERPQRCRKYDCRKDPNVWLDWEKRIINPHIFDHLLKKG